MVWGAIIGAVAGIGSSVLGASSQAASARAQNKAAKQQAERQYERSLKEWEISNATQMAQWQWDKARTEQLRFNERQAAADYDSYNAKLIAAAERNLAINSGALYDKYVTEEGLRGTQVGMEYSYTANKLGAESSEALRQYLNNVNQLALQSNATVARMTGETQELLGSLAMEQERDQLGWQINQIAAMARSAEARGMSVVRQGGGATAQRLAMDAGKQLGRAYGEIALKAQDRQLKTSLMNRAMNTGVARELANTALQMGDAADRMKYTTARYQADSFMAKAQMQNLAIPSFGMANKQYQRELDALQLQTQQVFDKAATPYRQQTYFDPLEPIKGLKPELISPTAVSSPSLGSVIGNSFLAGARGAMQASYKKPDGSIGFY